MKYSKKKTYVKTIMHAMTICMMILLKLCANTILVHITENVPYITRKWQRSDLSDFFYGEMNLKRTIPTNTPVLDRHWSDYDISKVQHWPNADLS